MRVKKKIGTGSFGEVYQIKDVSTNELMAIKTINIKGNYKCH